MYFEDALDRVLGVHYKENLSEISKKVILAKEKKEGDLKAVLEEKLEKEIFIKNYKDALSTIDELKKRRLIRKRFCCTRKKPSK